MDLHPVIELETCLARSSPFYFGEGMAQQFPDYLKRQEFDRCFLVTSPKLLELFGRELLGILEHHTIHCRPVLINESEAHKDWSTLRDLCEELTALGVTKDSILIALGGGVIGNVTGLAAGLIYRGIRFVQVPTTITAQTDSTLSNKQAINGALGKNQFGVYHPPLFVWADAAYPRSEPARQQKAGVVEGIKNILITHDSLEAAEEMIELYRSANRLPDLLLSLIRSKLQILRRDPTEKSYAMTLEYGHTFGHAIEWLSRGKLLHGEAISIGMCLAAELSHAMGYASPRLVADHDRLLGKLLGTPTRLPADLSPETVYETMLSDNKRTRRGLRFLLLERPGQFVNPEGDYMVAAPRELVLRIMRESQKQSNQPKSLAG